MRNYDINDYLKDDKELQKAVIQELLAEVETRDNLSETFRKEALSWANIANECQKDNKHLNDLLDNALKEQEELRAENDRLKQESKELAHYLACMTEQRNKANTILQKIKDIVSKITDGYIRPYGDYNQLKQILDLITKAEEE